MRRASAAAILPLQPRRAAYGLAAPVASNHSFPGSQPLIGYCAYNSVSPLATYQAWEGGALRKGAAGWLEELSVGNSAPERVRRGERGLWNALAENDDFPSPIIAGVQAAFGLSVCGPRPRLPHHP